MTAEQALLVQARWHNVCEFGSICIFSAFSDIIWKWYRADWDYGRTTVYFFCAAIFAFGLVNVMFQLRQRAT